MNEQIVNRPRWVWLVLLTGVLLVAFWLRWRYVQEISLYVDEFTTLWAAKQVQLRGVPIMPSGVLYTRGLLASYVEAAFLTVLGFGYTVGRLPNLLFGLATILCVFWIGRREWRAASVGWLAAVGLALLPEAIIWSSRARFYAQLQFFTLLTVWAAYRMVAAAEPTAQSSTRNAQSTTARWSHSLLFALLFTLALYSQEETVLLYPVILMATIGWQGWRFLVRGPVLAAHLLCAAALGLRFALEIWGQPGYFETIQTERPYVGFILDWLGAWRVYGPLLIAPERLPWTIGSLIAIGVALAHWRQSGLRVCALPAFQQATLWFALHFGFVLVVILLFVGSTWREARYLLLVQPFWLLTGAAGWVWLVTQFVKRTRAANLLLTALAVIFALLLYPAAERVFSQQVEGYDRVLGYVSSVRLPNDVILSPQPPACALVLQRCDFYALQRGYEEFVIERDGVLIDRWTGAQLLNSTALLTKTLQTAPRTWLITDSFRLATRYEPDFVRMVIEQFDLESQARGVMALQADGWRELPNLPISRTLAPPELFTPLALTGWEQGEVKLGEGLPVTFFWRSTEPISQQFNTSLRLVAADSSIVKQHDGPPARGMIPTTLFFDTPVPDPKMVELPAELAPGRYRLDVAAYDVTTLTPLREPYAFTWVWTGPPPAPPAQSHVAQWENGLQLVGHDGLAEMLTPGTNVSLRLVWTAAGPVTADYTAFVHLVDGAGNVVAQHDRAPEGGFYPTSRWAVGEMVAEFYELALPPELPAGMYQLRVGWYQPTSSERAMLTSGTDAEVLAQVEVLPKE